MPKYGWADALKIFIVVRGCIVERIFNGGRVHRPQERVRLAAAEAIAEQPVAAARLRLARGRGRGSKPGRAAARCRRLIPGCARLAAAFAIAGSAARAAIGR
jgi:hypothetical protein